MATNKRKDAAALFELLDNSTLKVPKNAGSLKIPSWWSSKTNPAPTDIPDDLPEADFEQAGTAVATAVTPAEPQLPLQSRMFEPPPSGEVPAAMPSIRPPSALAAAAPTAPAVIGTTSAAQMLNQRPARSTANVVSPPKPPIDPSVPVAPKEPKIFAPQMYAQQRRQWVTPRPGAFARMPGWVLGSSAAAALLIVVTVVFIASRKHNNTALGSGTGDSSVSTPVVTAPPTPDRTVSAPIGPVVQASNTVRTPVPAPVPQTPKVFGPGEVDRDYNLYYIIIASTPSRDVAERNAQFIAGKGVSVSLEVDKKGLFHLVSVEGFPSNSAAQPLRSRIVEIGHQTDAYKRTHRAWDDAMIQFHLSTPK